MAGRVSVVSAVAILGLLCAHVSAFYMPPIMPLVHGGLFPVLPTLGVRQLKPKPLSRPFTMADLPPFNAPFSLMQSMAMQQGPGLFVDVDNGFGGDSINVINPGFVSGGLAAATNTLNSVNLVGASSPLALGNGLEVLDSAVAVNGGAATAVGALAPGLAGFKAEDSRIVAANPVTDVSGVVGATGLAGVTGVTGDVPDTNVLVRNPVTGALSTGLAGINGVAGVTRDVSDSNVLLRNPVTGAVSTLGTGLTGVAGVTGDVSDAKVLIRNPMTGPTVPFQPLVQEF